MIEQLREAHILTYFDEVIAGDMVAKSKPEPDIFEHLPPKKTGVCLLYCFVLSPLISLGAVPHTISLSLSKS